jgi:hypothetical protein
MGDEWINKSIEKVFPGIAEEKKSGTAPYSNGTASKGSSIKANDPRYVAQYVAFLEHILNRAKEENNYDLLDELVKLLGPSEDAIDTDNQPNNILDAITELLQTRKLQDETAPPTGDGLLDAIGNLLGSSSAVQPSAPIASGDILQAIDDLLKLSDSNRGPAVAPAEPNAEPTKGILESIDELLQPPPGQGPALVVALPSRPGQGEPGEPASGPSAPASTSCNDANVCIEQIDNNERVTNTTTYNIVDEGKEAKIDKKVKEVKDVETSTDQTSNANPTSP